MDGYIVNNYEEQSVSEPDECPICFTSMTEQQDGRLKYLKCDNTQCAETKELTEAEQYEADANADYITEQIPNV